MARAKAPKNTGSQGFIHTSTPNGSTLKAPTMSMAMPGESASKPPPMDTAEMTGMMDSMPNGMMESM